MCCVASTYTVAVAAAHQAKTLVKVASYWSSQLVGSEVPLHQPRPQSTCLLIELKFKTLPGFEQKPYANLQLQEGKVVHCLTATFMHTLLHLV